MSVDENDIGVVFDEASAVQIAEATRVTLGLSKGHDAGGSGGGSSPGRQPQQQRWLPFCNGAGSIIPPCSIIDLTSDFQVAGNQELLFGTMPGATFSRSFAVTSLNASPSPDGGLCTLSGPVTVAYDGGTPARGETWGPKPSQWQASKGYPGFYVLGVVDSDNKLMSVLFEKPIALIALNGGSNIAAISGASPGSGMVTVYALVGGSLASTTWTVTAYNLSTQAVSAGAWVQIKFASGYWWVDFEACTPS